MKVIYLNRMKNGILISLGILILLIPLLLPGIFKMMIYKNSPIYFSKMEQRIVPLAPVTSYYRQEIIYGVRHNIPINTLTKKEDLKEKMIADQDDILLLAQLCQAEAGNQGIDGMRMVVDVVLNRMDSYKYPDIIEEVIFDPGQFGVITDGAFDRAGEHIREGSYQAALIEYYAEDRLNGGVLYFNNSPACSGKNIFQMGGHWFGY